MSFEVIPSEEIAHRVDFSLLCNARGYVRAVEVGVDMGHFAKDFMARWDGHWWIGIDPYGPYAEMPWLDRTLDMAMAVQAMAPYHGRVRFIRAASLDVAARWPPWIDRPDFCYIDGSHEEADVYCDLVAWWGMLPEDRGMLAGHDFDEGHPGVVAAVNRFAEERGLVVRLTHEKDAPPSWYIYRQEPERLFVRCFRSDEVENPRAGGG